MGTRTQSYLKKRLRHRVAGWERGKSPVNATCMCYYQEPRKGTLEHDLTYTIVREEVLPKDPLCENFREVRRMHRSVRSYLSVERGQENCRFFSDRQSL